MSPSPAEDRERAASGWVLPAVVAVVRRPALWPTAAAQMIRLAAPGWWRRRPFLPLPDPGYLRFRLETAYGDDRDPQPADIVTYLHWCRECRQTVL